jgi:phospholipid transport system substrate-binding protein
MLVGAGRAAGPAARPAPVDEPMIGMTRMPKFFRRAAALALFVFAGAASLDARAEPAASATPMIDTFDHTLLGVMKDAVKLGYQGRYDRLQPVIRQVFNVPLMTQLVVGSSWSDWSKEQRDEVTDAFCRFIVATYARRFDGYSGEDFVVDGERASGSGTVVMTRLTRPKEAPVTINYLVRANGDGAPQVVDVYLTGTISELATRRSEFGAVLQHEGYKGLLAALDKKASSQSSVR